MREGYNKYGNYRSGIEQLWNTEAIASKRKKKVNHKKVFKNETNEKMGVVEFLKEKLLKLKKDETFQIGQLTGRRNARIDANIVEVRETKD